MRKVHILLLMVLVLFTLCSFQFVLAEDEISLVFYDGESEITPSVSGDVYTIEYHEDMKLNIKGSLSGNPDEKSVLRIKKEGNIYEKTDVNSFSNAGTYELMIDFGGEVVKSKYFTLVIEKKKVTEASFDQNTLSIEYGEVPSPLLILPDGVYGNATVKYEFYTVGGDKLEKIDGVGNYKVKGIIEGKNYFGEIEDDFIVKKASCTIEVENDYVEANYKISEAGVNGYDLQKMLGVTVKGSTFERPLTYKVKGNSDKDFTEARYIRKVDSYIVEISFEGNQNNFEHGSVSATFILTKSDITFAISSYITVTYDDNLDVAKVVRDDMYLDEYGYSVYGGGEKLGQDFSSALLKITFYEDSDCTTEMAEPPKDASNDCYYYKLSFDGNDYYNMAESAPSKLIIERKNIVKEISIKVNNVYRSEEDYDIATTFTIPAKYDQEPTFSYYKASSVEGELDESLDEKPTMPGNYLCRVAIQANNYYASFNVSFSIERIAIPQDKLTVSNLEYTYGDRIEVSAVLADYDVDGLEISYYSKDTKLENPPINAGIYRVIVSVVDEMYRLEVEKELTINKKRLTITINPMSAVYGDNILIKKNGVYQEDYLSFDGLINDDKAEVISGISLYVSLGEQELYEKSSLLVVGNYTVKAHGEHRNYDITYQDGNLAIVKRTLNISVGNIEQYIGYKLAPQITVTNTAYTDQGADIAILFECYYTEASGREVTDLVSGRYSIKVRLKGIYEGNSALANYSPNYINGVLNLLSNEKKDEGGNITIIGKFSADENFKVRTDIPASDYSKAIQKTSGKADVTEFYYIPYALPTTDGSSFKLRLKSSSVAKEGVMLLVSFDGQEFIEQEFTIVNGQMELTLTAMPSYYAVCVPTESNLPLIIGLAVGGVVILIAVAVLIKLWHSGAFVKAKKKDETKLSEGVIAPTDGRKSEDDELDEIIEQFDYSTVKKEENPAERLARKEMEELREQYRLRLRRMRNMGDKSISDTMTAAGIDGASFDEEEAITKMIQADEARRKKEEEERLKAEEEEKAKKEKETSFVVNERKTGTLSGGGVAPKAPRNVDDDDF